MLSGGGHRAMIGGIGAILYLVQANWWPRVDEVISVSGGSVTNAALMGSTSEDDQEQINNLRRLYDVIRTDRVLPWRTPARLLWFLAVIAAPLFTIVLALSAFGIIDLIPVPQTAWVGMLLGILGPLISIQLGRRAFSRYIFDYVQQAGGSHDMRLEGLAERDRQHVICATGRASAQTYYLWGGGPTFSSGGDLATPRASQQPDPDMLGVAAQSMNLGAATYSSCSLPLLGFLKLPDSVTHSRAMPGEVLIDPGWTGKFGQQVSDRLNASGNDPQASAATRDPLAPKIILIDAGTRIAPQGLMAKLLTKMSITSLLFRWTNLANDAVYVNDLIDAVGASVLVRISDDATDEIATGAVGAADPNDQLAANEVVTYLTAPQIWGRFKTLRTNTATISLFNVTEQRGFDALLAGFVGSYMALTPDPDGIELYRLLEQAGARFGVAGGLAHHWDPNFHQQVNAGVAA